VEGEDCGKRRLYYSKEYDSSISYPVLNKPRTGHDGDTAKDGLLEREDIVIVA